MGQHQFEYKIDKSFFDEFPYSIVKNGQLEVKLELEKRETFFILQFQIFGHVVLSCDLCLAEYFYNIDRKERLIIKLSEHDDWTENTEEVIILTKNDHEIDISLPLYDFINLAVPYIRRCDSGGSISKCDPVMIAKLNELAKNKKNIDKKSVGSPWEPLKNIQIDKN